jgi:MraZ protein
MIFTFAYERTIDAKKRLQIPAPFRNGWDPARDGSAWILSPGVRENTLSLYTERYFEKLAGQIRTEFIPDPESIDFEQAFYGAVARQEWDSQGRIVIPDELYRMVDLGREVVLAGAKVRIDIWRKADFIAFREKDMKGRWMVFPKYLRRPASPFEGHDAPQ